MKKLPKNVMANHLKIKGIPSATGSKVVVGNNLAVNMIFASAKQPGQKTKPYCRDADDRAAMSKEESKRARKAKEDPNQTEKEGKERETRILFKLETRCST